MQTQQLIQTVRINQTISAATRSQRPSSFLQLVNARAQNRKMRVAFSPRREVCLTKRAILAALREAEFNEWMNSGGDHLDSMHQPIN